MRCLSVLRRRSRGASGLTYGLLLGLISIAALSAIVNSGQTVNRLFNTVSGRLVGIQPPVTAAAVASQGRSCRDHQLAGITTSGVQTIDPDGPGGDPAFQTWCDMVTDGGGWSLVGYSTNASTSESGSNQQMPSLGCGGGGFSPTSRSGSAATVKAIALARISTEIGFGIAGSVATGNMTNHTYVSKFSIPNPSAVTFANNSFFANASKGNCVAVTVTGLKGESGTATRYTYANSLGPSWTDSYPTGYGAIPSSNCTNDASAGPFITNVFTGDNTSSSDICRSPNRAGYVHVGNRSMLNTNLTGDMSIWLR